MPIGFYDQSQVGQSISPNQQVYAKIMGLVPPDTGDASTVLGAPVADTPLDPVAYQRASLFGGQQGSYGGTRDFLLREQAGLQSPKLESGMPTQHMLGKALVGALLARIIGGKRAGGVAAQGILGGVQQGAQMGAETKNKQSMMDFQRQQNILGTEAKIADSNAQEADNLRKEKLGENRYQQSRLDKIAADKADLAGKKELAGLKSDTDATKAARKVLNDPKSTKTARAAALIDLEADGIVYPPDLKQQYLESTYYEDNVKAKTTGIVEKTNTEVAMREPRLKQLDANIAKVIQGTAKDKVQAEFLAKKVENFDDEFKLRASRAYADLLRAEKYNPGKGPGGSGGSVGASVNQQRLLLTKIISLNQAQLKQTPMLPSTMLKRAFLQKEIDDATERIRQLVPGGMPPVNPLALNGPIGSYPSGPSVKPPPASNAFPWKPRK